MKNLRQLTPNEVLFIGGETPNVYQHTAGLVLLDASDNPDFGYDYYRRHMEKRMGGIPHLRWRLHEVPLGLDLPYWVEDDKFSFDRHIRQIAVPSPGDDKALAELVAYLYSRHLDRKRPLWESWFIEGLPPGQFAVVSKMHHCMMDGEGATSLSAAVNDLEPDAAPREIDPAIAGAEPGQVPEHWRQSLNTAWKLSSLPMNLSREVVGLLNQGIRQQLTRRSTGKGKTPFALAPFNGDIGTQRGFVFGSLPLQDIKVVKNHFGCKLNEVLLSLVGGSLRNYLLAHEQLPGHSLRTFMAVSLRSDKDDPFSNKVTSVAVTLGTDIGDPARRLRAIAEDSETAKTKAHRGHMGFMEVIEPLPPVVVNAMMRMTPGKKAAEMVGSNLIVSNVHGIDRPIYTAGARVIGQFPMSIITQGSGINITCISYAGDVDIGITVDPQLVPEPWSIIDGLHTALEEYTALARKPSSRVKTPAR